MSSIDLKIIIIFFFKVAYLRPYLKEKVKSISC